MVLVQSGDVSQLGDRAGYRATIKPCGIVNQQQIIKTGPDGYAKFQVSDGSTFEVFPNSEVTFRKTYGIGDLLNVWMGKVKVYIQHLPGIPEPEQRHHADRADFRARHDLRCGRTRSGRHDLRDPG